jgi:hypothetical protein
MNEHTITIPVSLTPAEMAALEVATRVYLDLLEVVLPLQPDPTRVEAIHQLGAFKDRCERLDAQRKDPADALFSTHVPFKELMIVTTAIEAYEYMDRIHCLPAMISDLTSIEVIALTRSFQRRMIST